jgi:transcriptional regulator with XRE-family HTH domain
MERPIESPLDVGQPPQNSERPKSRVSFDIDRRTALGRGLKTARNRAGMTVKEAASKLSSLGLECKRGTLLAWERGGGRSSREPFASDLAVIATLYGCQVNEFFPHDAPDFGNGRESHHAELPPGNSPMARS